jgi:hypothetical protein
MTVRSVNLNQALATFTDGYSPGPGGDLRGALGTEHKPSGTSTTGDRHEGEIPAHVDSTTGRDI